MKRETTKRLKKNNSTPDDGVQPEIEIDSETETETERKRSRHS